MDIKRLDKSHKTIL